MRGCRHAKQRILRAVDHELPLEESFLLDDHLARCIACAEYRARVLILEEALVRMPEPTDDLVVERAVRSVRDALEADGPDDSCEAFLCGAANDGERSSARSSSSWPSWIGIRGAVAAAVAVGSVVSGAVVWFEREGPTALRETKASAAVAAARPTRSADVGAPSPVPDTPPGTSLVNQEPTRDDVQRRLRASLVAAFGEDLDARDLASALARFDERAAALLVWPLARLAEPLLGDEDMTLARCAARFLGRRGDRISVARLEAAAQRDELAPTVVLALGDLGDVAVPALASLLDRPLVAADALAQLGRIGGRAAADAIAASLRRRVERDRSASTDEHLRALARTGTASVAPLLQLAASPSLERELVLESLQRVEGGPQEFARLVLAARARYDVALVLEVAARLQPSDVLAWVEERAAEFRTRAGALDCLARWNATAPFASLLRLDASGAVGGNELVETLRLLAERDGARMADFAAELVAAGNALDLERFLELLVASEHRRAAGALVVIALSDLLPEDARQWAALAAGELGDADDAHDLLRGVGRFGSDERRLFAACLITLHRHLGPNGVAEALDGFTPRSARRVHDALATVSSPAEPDGSTGRGQATGASVALFRVARALDGAFVSRSPKLTDASL